MAKNTFIKKAVQEYEDVLENNGAGARILAAFTEIGKWMGSEEEVDEIITWPKARKLARFLVLRPDTYAVVPEAASELRPRCRWGTHEGLAP